MKNRYVNRSKISEAKFRELIRFFALDLTAVQISKLTGLNRNTVNRYLTEIRKKISFYCHLTAPIPHTDAPDPNAFCDVNEFNILIKELDGKVYTQLIGRSEFGRLYSGKENGEGYFKFDLLIDLKKEKHHFIGSIEDGQGSYRARLNRIESFWSSARSRLVKFKGMRSSTYQYHLKECEFRYNNRDRDLYTLLLTILRKYPLFE